MDDAQEKRLAAVEARLDALERRPRDITPMKERRCCPACGCTKLIHTNHVRADLQVTFPMALSVMQPGGRFATRGTFELHVCSDCGLVEWHVLDLEPRILEDAHLTLLEPLPDPEKGPFR